MAFLVGFTVSESISRGFGMDPFENKFKGTTQQIVQVIKDKADDISEVVIGVHGKIPMHGPAGQYEERKGAGTINFVDGDIKIVDARALEAMLNDGLLNRLRIKIRLIPLADRGEGSQV